MLSIDLSLKSWGSQNSSATLLMHGHLVAALKDGLQGWNLTVITTASLKPQAVVQRPFVLFAYHKVCGDEVIVLINNTESLWLCTFQELSCAVEGQGLEQFMHPVHWLALISLHNSPWNFRSITKTNQNDVIKLKTNLDFYIWGLIKFILMN